MICQIASGSEISIYSLATTPLLLALLQHDKLSAITDPLIDKDKRITPASITSYWPKGTNRSRHVQYVEERKRWQIQ